MKTQTRAILASVVVIALALSAVSGVTYSWWSASENTEIEITTGYLDVDTSDFTMYDVTNADKPVLILEADDAPEKIDLASVISKNNTIGADSVLAPNDVDEKYRIQYSVQFSANIYSKYIIGCTSTGGEDWILVDPSISNQAAANEWQYFLGTADSQNTPNGKLDDSTSVTVTVDVTLDDDMMPQNVSERITITNQILQVAMPYGLLVQDMIKEGWDVTLQDDIETDVALEIPAGYNGVLDLNGFTITRNGPGVAIDNYGRLTIIDGGISGKVQTKDQSQNGNNVLLNKEGAKLVVEGGTFDSASGNALCNYGTAVVNGGTFTGEEYKIIENVTIHGYAIASLDGSVTINDATVEGLSQGAVAAEGGDVIVNGGSFTIGEGSFYALFAAGGDVIVNGGSFEKTDMGVSANMFYKGTDGNIILGPSMFKGGSGVSVNFKTVTLSEGMVVKKISDYEYAVTNPEFIFTADQLIENLDKDMDVSFYNDIKIDPAGMSNAYGATGISVKNGQTIDGNGHTLDIKGAGGTWDSGISTTGGLIKDITVTGSFRGIFINHDSTHSEPVVLENVTIDGTTYTISCDQGMNQNFEAYDCTFNGWTSYAATLGSAIFDGCYFGEGNGYAYCRPYAPTTFTNCEFEADYTMDPRAAVTFENCTLGGVEITSENLSDLVTNTANATVIQG